MNKSAKLSLAVIFGGVSSEHEVSRMSVTSILENLSNERYEVHMVGITKEGRWLLYTGPVEDILSGAWEQGPVTPAFLSPDPSVHGLVALRDGKAETIHVDVIFPALHGKNGEDGTIQGLFQLSGIPEQAHYLWFYADRFDAAPDTIKNKIQARLDFPVFVKPSNAGSSVGVSKVERFEDLDQAIRKAAREDKKVVVEEGITGQEVEVAVLGNRDCDASLVGEIGASAQFYDYDDKYINGTSQLYIPARIPQEVSEKIRQTAVRAYRLLGCSGLARVDFFVTAGDNRVILNEINTLPGFTSISMYPKLWMAMGLSYGELLDKLIELALQRAGQ